MSEVAVNKLARELGKELFGPTKLTETMVKRLELCLSDAMFEFFKTQPYERQLELFKFQLEVHGVL